MKNITSMSRKHICIALFAAALLAACGGGETATPTEVVGADGTPVTDVPAALEFTPTTLQASTNDPFTIQGEGFVAPVEIRFLDAQGNLLGSVVDADARANGTRIEGEAPMLPDVTDEPVTVEIRNGNGEIMTIPGVRFVNEMAELRTIDGSANNETTPTLGQAGTALRDDVGRAYGDGISTPAGEGRLSARAISSLVCAQDGSIESTVGASDMFWLWGQFLDHDIDLTGEAVPEESFPIQVPQGDIWFDPTGSGDEELPFHRSAWLASTGTDTTNWRRQPNEITSWIDASNVYGSDAVRAAALRTLDGTGRLKTSDGDLLPFNTDALPNAPTAFDPTFFLAGDVRASEQVGLTAMHTLFVREHNRLVDDMREENPHLTGDQLYEAARCYVAALMQVITYHEFLPMLLGPHALGPYQGYDASVDASIGVGFSTAMYRFGHTMVSSEVWRIDAEGNEVEEGHLSLRDAFFNPAILVEEGGIDPVLRGFAAKPAQELDELVVDDLRNFLFGAPGSGGLDLAALNIQRGRDHGLPDYNAFRVAHGLPALTSFSEVSQDPSVVEKLEAAYDTVNDIDPWLGGLCEDPAQGAMVGRLLQAALADQFRRLRDGDRFWYERLYSGPTLERLERTRLSDVIRRNTGIGNELSNAVMSIGEDGGRPGDGDNRPPRPSRSPATLEAVMSSVLR